MLIHKIKEHNKDLNAQIDELNKNSQANNDQPGISVNEQKKLLEKNKNLEEEINTLTDKLVKKTTEFMKM